MPTKQEVSHPIIVLDPHRSVVGVFTGYCDGARYLHCGEQTVEVARIGSSVYLRAETHPFNSILLDKGGDMGAALVMMCGFVYAATYAFFARPDADIAVPEIGQLWLIKAEGVDRSDDTAFWVHPRTYNHAQMFMQQHLQFAYAVEELVSGATARAKATVHNSLQRNRPRT